MAINLIGVHLYGSKWKFIIHTTCVYINIKLNEFCIQNFLLKKCLNANLLSDYVQNEKLETFLLFSSLVLIWNLPETEYNNEESVGKIILRWLFLSVFRFILHVPNSNILFFKYYITKETIRGEVGVHCIVYFKYRGFYLIFIVRKSKCLHLSNKRKKNNFQQWKRKIFNLDKILFLKHSFAYIL